MPEFTSEESVQELLRLVAERLRHVRRKPPSTGAAFNIFDLLGVSHAEVSCHSRLIAELLNPAGCHGQGTAFLQRFLNLLAAEWAVALEDFPKEVNSCPWSVEVEKSFRGAGDGDDSGRVDIAIIAGDRVLVVENKIHANDQPRQLERYKAWANTSYQRVYLAYLTLHGGTPGDFTRGEVREKEVICLSYSTFIHDWMTDCIEAAALVPHLRETLYQYLEVVRQLTGQGSNVPQASIGELMEERPDRLLASRAIHESMLDARTELEMRFWGDLGKALAEHVEKAHPGWELLADTRSVTPDQVKTNLKRKSENKTWYGLTVKLADLPKGRRLALAVENDGALFYGFIVLDEAGHVEATDDEMRDWGNPARGIPGMKPLNKYWLASRTFLPYSGQSDCFHWDQPICFRFPNETTIQLADEDERRKRAKRCAKQCVEAAEHLMSMAEVTQ